MEQEPTPIPPKRLSAAARTVAKAFPGIADTVAALDEHDPYRDAENPYAKGGPSLCDPFHLSVETLKLHNEPLTTAAIYERSKQAPISSCSHSFKDMTGCVWPIVVERYEGGGVTIRTTSEPPADGPYRPQSGCKLGALHPQGLSTMLTSAGSRRLPAA